MAEAGALSTKYPTQLDQAVDEENLGRFWSPFPPLFSLQTEIPGTTPSTAPACLPFPTINLHPIGIPPTLHTTSPDVEQKVQVEGTKEGLDPDLILCTPDVPNYDDSPWYDPAWSSLTEDECKDSVGAGSLYWAGVFDPNTLPSFDPGLSFDKVDNMDDCFLLGLGSHAEDFLADTGGDSSVDLDNTNQSPLFDSGVPIVIEDFLVDTGGEGTLGLDANNPILASDGGPSVSRIFVPEGAIFPLPQNYIDDGRFSTNIQFDEGPLISTTEKIAAGIGDDLLPGFDINDFPFF